MRLGSRARTPVGRTDGRRGRDAGHRKRRLRWILVGGAALLVLLGLDAAWAAFSVHSRLSAARDDLRSGADAFLAGRMGEAARNFAAADTSSRGAEAFGHHPAAFLGGVLPWIGTDVHAVE